MIQSTLPFATGIQDRKSLRSRAITAIRQQLKEGERKDWKPLRSEFATVPDRTWWRWVASAKKAHSADKMNVAERYSEPGSGEMSAINSQNRHEFVKRKIRAADFATAMVRQMRDIDLLQEYAMTEDGKIKNPAVFERALALRERQMSSFIKTLAPTIDQLEWEDVSGAIIDTIAALDKEVSAQIMTALHNLRRQYNGGRG